MNPRISIVLNTKQELYPMPGLEDESIYSILIKYLKEQSFDNFELIIVDGYFEERKDSFQYLKLPFPFKYTHPKPSPWDNHEHAIHISSDRNTGIMLARGELIMCLDDCIVPMFGDTFQQIIEWWDKGFLLRPMLNGKDYETTDPTGTGFCFIDDFYKEMKKHPERKLGSGLFVASGHRGGVFLFPAWIYERLNGFDERFDSMKRNQDCDFTDRADMLGIKRFSFPREHPFVRIEHAHEIYNLNTNFVCNEAYMQYARIQTQHHGETRANQRILDSSDVEAIKSRCKSCHLQGACKKDEPPGLDFYLKYQPVFDLAAKRKEMIQRYGEATGVVEVEW